MDFPSDDYNEGYKAGHRAGLSTGQSRVREFAVDQLEEISNMPDPTEQRAREWRICRSGGKQSSLQFKFWNDEKVSIFTAAEVAKATEKLQAEWEAKIAALGRK